MFNNMKYNIQYRLWQLRDYLEYKKYKSKYPDYVEDDYNCGDLQHIWGVTSYDDLSGKEANLYTMNDIDITYNRDTEEYMLGVETAYLFNGNTIEEKQKNECKYLKRLLDVFTQFMNSNNYDTNGLLSLFMMQLEIPCRAKSIEELYLNFKMFVEGFCKVCEFKEDN